MYDPGDITGLLNRWTTGDPEAGDSLAPLIYSELHRLAERIFRGEHHGHTLQPTALVNEVFEKLVSVDVARQDRAHFFPLAARMMRRLLVDYARLRNSRKRGGDALKVTFDESQLAGMTEVTGLHPAPWTGSCALRAPGYGPGSRNASMAIR